MSEDELDAAFDAIVADLGELAPATPQAETPAMDAVMDWRLRDGHIVVTGRRPDVVMLTGFVRAARAGSSFTYDASALADGDEVGDPVTATVLLHHDELVSSVDRALAAAEELLTGGIPLTGCFDAARGLQHLRVRLLGTDEHFHSGDRDADDLVEHLLVLASLLAEDLLTLALADPNG